MLFYRKINIIKTKCQDEGSEFNVKYIFHFYFVIMRKSHAHNKLFPIEQDTNKKKYSFEGALTPLKYITNRIKVNL